jgi:5'(3')-deoxyribonucleotidase
MKKILYFDMDNVLVDFESALRLCDSITLDMYKGRYDEIPGLFIGMEPMPGAIDVFHRLSEVYDSYILSTAPWENPSAWFDKLMWVKTHLGEPAHKRLILSHNKHLNIGDFLIDDRTKNGADRFQGEHIHFGTNEFPDWETVETYLMSRL